MIAHPTIIRTGLPSAYFRALNGGVLGAVHTAPDLDVCPSQYRERPEDPEGHAKLCSRLEEDFRFLMAMTNAMCANVLRHRKENP